MRLSFSSFVNNLLITINRAPGKLHPISGWLNVTIFEVACRRYGVEPTVSLFFALFSISHTPFQTKFLSRRKRKFLVGARQNKVLEGRWHKKWFLVRGGMAIGVPCIWTLQDEANNLPICFAADNDVAISLKAKPRDSLIPETLSAAPPPISIPVVTSAPKKKTAQVLARDSEEEAALSFSGESQVGLMQQPAIHTQPRVVDLESSTIVSDQRAAHPNEGHISFHEEWNSPFPPSLGKPAPSSTNIEEATPEEEVRQRKGKAAATGPSLQRMIEDTWSFPILFPTWR
ncbi:hypothetical protein LIER_21994 [Lithospermum erythrorhizon]|uniref:Uncharacterized protein n=1 Tax=Lithospermum erythrorhizon TaxID=34254 RepID=A0AAV3QUP6_LITER